MYVLRRRPDVGLGETFHTKSEVIRTKQIGQYLYARVATVTGYTSMVQTYGFEFFQTPEEFGERLPLPIVAATSDWDRWLVKNWHAKPDVHSLKRAKKATVNYKHKLRSRLGGVTVVLTAHGMHYPQAIPRALDQVRELKQGSHLVVVQNSQGAVKATQALPGDKLMRRVYTENNGFAAACNAGLAKAMDKTKWVLFTQPDCKWRAKAVRDAIAIATAYHPKTAVVGPSGGFVLERGQIKEHGSNVGKTFEPEQVDFIAGYWVLVQKEALLKIGGWDEGYFLYYEDPDLCLRLAEIGLPSVAVPKLKVDHVRSGTIRHCFNHSVRGEIRTYSKKRFVQRWL